MNGRSSMNGRLVDILFIAAGLAALGMLASSDAHAREYVEQRLTWAAPTTRADGAPFSPATDLAGYDLKVTLPAAAGNGASTSVVEIAATATSHPIATYPTGASFTLSACDKAGRCSVPSASVKAPAAPGSVTIKIE